MSATVTAIGLPGPVDPLVGRADSPRPPRTAPQGGPPEDSRAARDDGAEAAGTTPETRIETASLPEFGRRELSIRREPELDQVVVQVLDSETKEVIRQIPPDEVLSVLRQLQKTGLLLDKKG